MSSKSIDSTKITNSVYKYTNLEIKNISGAIFGDKTTKLFSSANKSPASASILLVPSNKLKLFSVFL